MTKEKEMAVNDHEHANNSVATVCDVSVEVTPQVESEAEANQELSLNKETPNNQTTKDIEVEEEPSSLPPLDSARGWLVILGAFFIQLLAFGTASSWGVMQAMYEEVFKHEPDVQLKLSFAGTLMEAFVNLMGPVAQIIMARFGVKTLLISGSFLAVIGLEMASFTSAIWHLYLCQGIVFGSGASLMYCCVMNTAPRWFDKKRGLAMGLASSGSGLGGLVLPFILNAVNKSLGAGWTYRVLGFIVLLCCVFACVLVKDRVKLERKSKPIKELFQLSVFKDLNYVLWIVGSVIALSGFFVPYFFMPSYANHLGLSSDQGTALIAVMSTGNFLGRVLVGYTADRIGRLNANIIWIITCGACSLLIWTFAFSYGILMAYCILFGLYCGSYFTLLSPITLDIVGPERFPTALSILLMGNIFSVFGPSIASAIQIHVETPFLVYKIFTGFTYVLGGLILVVLKIRLTKSIWARF